MKQNEVSLARGALLEALQAAGSAVAVRPTLQVLGSLLLEAVEERQILRVTGTDLEMALQMDIRAAVGASWGAVVPAREFTAWVKALDEGVVTLRLDEERQRLQCYSGPSTGSFAVMAAEEFPPVPFEMPPQAIVLEAGLFRRVARDVVVAAATVDARPGLTGIVLAGQGDGLEAAASDGYRLAVLALGKAKMPSAPVVIPAEVWRKASPYVGSETVTVGWNDRHAIFALDERVRMMSMLIDVKYPPYRQIVPEQFGVVGRIQKRLLLAALRQVTVFAPGSGAVRLDFTATGLEISAHSAELGEGKAAVPMALEGEPLTIGMNVNFLYDAVRSVESETVVLQGNAPQLPWMVSGAGDDAFFHIIMPMSYEE